VGDVEISSETLGLLFVSLFTLYSPLSDVGAYASLTEHLSRRDQKRIAWRVLRNVVVIMLVFVWAGDLLFEVLGVSSDTLRVTGGIALMAAGCR
jgi:multiple antibiotic resistance protein